MAWPSIESAAPEATTGLVSAEDPRPIDQTLGQEVQGHVCLPHRAPVHRANRVAPQGLHQTTPAKDTLARPAGARDRVIKHLGAYGTDEVALDGIAWGKLSGIVSNPMVGLPTPVIKCKAGAECVTHELEPTWLRMMMMMVRRCPGANSSLLSFVQCSYFFPYLPRFSISALDTQVNLLFHPLCPHASSVSRPQGTRDSCSTGSSIAVQDLIKFSNKT